MEEYNLDFSTPTDATSTDAEIEVLTDINNNITDIKYCVMLFLLLWVVLSCKKIVHNAIRMYMDITKK